MWLLYSLLSAFFDSIRLAFSKKVMKELDEYTLLFVFVVFPVPVFLVLMLYNGIPVIDPYFWIVVAVHSFIVVIANLLYLKAIKHSPLSLVAPFLMFTPLFLLATSPIMLGEFPTFYGLIGILFVVSGAYVISIKEKDSIFKPIVNIMHERGILFALIVAFLFSISSNMDKLAITYSDVYSYLFTSHVLTTLLVIPLFVLKSHGLADKIIRYKKQLTLIGFALALSVVFQMIAVTMAIVPYVMSVKRTSALFSIGLGYFMFHETKIRQRMFGAVFMLAGVLFIGLG